MIENEADGGIEAAIGKWLSAALSDPSVCDEMKLDIVNWFTCIERRDKDVLRYRWLRGRDLEDIAGGGVFAGLIPDNLVISGKDLDDAIDKHLEAT